MTLLAAYIANLAGAAPVEGQKSLTVSATGAGGLFAALVGATNAAQGSEGETPPILTPFELPATSATQPEAPQANAESIALREALTQGLGLPQGGAEIEAVIIENPVPGETTPATPILPAAVPDTNIQPHPPEDGQPLTPALQHAPVEILVPAPAAPQPNTALQNTDTAALASPVVQLNDKPAGILPVTRQPAAVAQAPATATPPPATATPPPANEAPPPANETPRPTGLENAESRASGHGQERVVQVAINHAARTNGPPGEPQSTPAAPAAKPGEDTQSLSRNSVQRPALNVPDNAKQGETRAQFAARGPDIVKTIVKPGNGQTLIQFQKFSSSDPAIATSPPTLTVNVPVITASPGPATANTPHVPVSALAVHIATQASNGARRFEIRLDPPELGRIDVRLNVSRDGQVMTHLVVERPETLELLQRDARQLERALQDAGLNTSEENMKFSLKDQGLAHGGKDQAEGDEDFASLTDSDDNDPPGVADDPMPPPIRYMATTGLDIHI